MGRWANFCARVSWLLLGLGLTSCGDTESDGRDVGDETGGASGTSATGGFSTGGVSGSGMVGGSGGTSSGGNGGGDSGNGGSGNGGSGNGGSSNGGSGNGGTAGSGGQAGTPVTGSAPMITGTSHGTCALDEAGTIHCWGLARIGMGEWAIPTGGFVSLHSSTDAVCAVRADRTMTCFPEPVGTNDLSYVPDRPVEQVALARGVICSTDEDGEASCSWGMPQYELTVPDGERFGALSAGVQFGCGVRETDGSILCWGSPGTDGCVWAPVTGQLDAPGGSFIQVSSQVFSSCAVETSGAVACWGAGEATDDPDEEFCDQLLNFGQSVPPQGSFRSVVVGSAHSCGIRSDGTIACWGAGDGAVDDCTDGGWHCNQSVPPGGTFEEVAVGGLHSCAIRADHTVTCWGWDGDGDGRTTPPPALQ